MVKIANAPVSFGVFEQEAEPGTVLPDGETVARFVSTTGYDGIDLGPVGFLGRRGELRDRLTRHDLALAGGWIDLPFHDTLAFDEALPALTELLDAFDEAGRRDDRPPALPTLAATSTPERIANPGGGNGLSLSGRPWSNFVANLDRAIDLVRERSFEPTFHPHACTYIETVGEIESLLDASNVGITLDTGHLILGGGSPLRAIADWSSRINHIHLKDVRFDVLRRVIEARGSMRDVWTQGAFVPLGVGDLPLESFLDSLSESDYAGWIVVEQDIMPRPGESSENAASDQKRNRDVLRGWYA